MLPRARRSELDGLRGLAVLLMLGQHLMVWLWDHDPGSPFALPLTAISAAGGMGAPLFITLAGCGSALGDRGDAASNRKSMLRGIGLLGLAYLLSLATPSWFSLRSFYVLHLLGVGLLVAPWCLRLSQRHLVFLTGAFAGLTALLQAMLGVPLAIGNNYMSARPLRPEFLDAATDTVVRALVAGHFPLLPWLMALLLGILAGKQLRAQEKLPMRTGLVALLVGAIGLGIGFSGMVPALQENIAFRLLSPKVPFFPCSPSLCVALGGAAVCLMSIAGKHPRPFAPLVPLGRISLTVLMIHLPLFRELSRPVQAWRNLDGAWTMAVMLGTMLAFTGLAHLWRRIEYRYGAEWLLRQVDRFAAPQPHTR